MKKKPIIVWMNGKKTKLKRNTNKTNTQRFNREHAASIDESDDSDNQIPTLTRHHDFDVVSEQYPSKKNKLRMYKPIIIATISAIVIGLCMGVFMLNMFVGIGEEVNGSAGSNLPMDTSNTSNTDSTTSESALSKITFEQINAFVLQAGVFSTDQNANKRAQLLKDAGFPTMKWKRNNQFYLLAGLSSTKEQGEILASNLKENDFEIYVKEWSTNETEIQLTKEEGEWLHSFRDVWYESLMSVTGQEAISLASWKGLMDRYPKQSNHLSAMFDTINNSYKEIAEGNQKKAQIILLNQWKQYEELLLE